MQLQGVRGSPLKITQYQYQQPPKSHERNPIKIVIDKIGADGQVRQQVVEQREDPHPQPGTYRSQPRKSHELPALYYTQPAPQPPLLARSQMFDRFTYNDHRDLKVRRTLKSLPTRHKA